MRHRKTFLEQISAPGKGLLVAFNAIQAQKYTPTFDYCVRTATSFLAKLS